MGKKSKTKKTANNQGGSWADRPDVIQGAEMMNIVPLSQCSNCYLDTSSNEKQLLCSNCKLVGYCSKDCQRAHWKKEHKKCCQLLADKKRAAKQAGHGRENRLLEEWKSKLREGRLESLVVFCFGMTKLKSLAKARGFVLLTVAFDYNLRTFVLQAPPEIAYTDEIGWEHKNTAKEIHAFMDVQNRQRAKDGKQGANVLVLISILGFEGSDTGVKNEVMQFIIDTGLKVRITKREPGTGRLVLQEEVDPGAPMPNLKDEALRGFYDFQLTSRKFDAWSSLGMENVRQQMNAIQEHPQFQALLFHALRMKPRGEEEEEEEESIHYKTHCVAIRVEMGRGLGQFQRLECFEVWSHSEAKERVQSKDRVECYQGILDASTALDADTKNGLPFVLPVVFDLGKDYLDLPECHWWNPEEEIADEFSSDKKARHAFQALQTAKPTTEVDYFPPLH